MPVTALMIHNTTAINSVIENITKDSTSLFSKRAFVHHFVANGMEEGEFDEAFEDLKAISSDYYEIEDTEVPEIGDEVDRGR